jgi:hypothetical protein
VPYGIDSNQKTSGKMTRNLIRSLAAVAGLSVALAACDGTGPERPSGVTLLLTDAPGNVDEAWVKIDRVYMQGTGGQTDLLSAQSEWIELTSLAGHTTATLAEGVATPPGTYGQMRFIVTEAYLVSGGKTYATVAAQNSGIEADGLLHIPSVQQTGFKVSMPDGGFTVPEAEIPVTVVVDFDVVESFGQQAGQSGRWVMRPSLRATYAAVSGEIEGVITLAKDEDGEPLVSFPAAEACGGIALDFTNFTPQAIGPDDAVVSGEVTAQEEGAEYAMTFVAPALYTMSYKDSFVIHVEDGEDAGDYQVSFEAEASPHQVTVPEAESVTVDYRITGIACEKIVDEG